jgi:hypothetical protein
MLQKNDKASKLGSAPIAVHQSAVPPADHGQESAEAAPLEVHAPTTLPSSVGSIPAWSGLAASEIDDGAVRLCEQAISDVAKPCE